MGWVELKRFSMDHDFYGYDAVAYGTVVGVDATHVELVQHDAEFHVIGKPSDWTALLDEKVQLELPVGFAWVPRYEPVGGSRASFFADADDADGDGDDDGGGDGDGNSRLVGVVRDTSLFRSMRLARRLPPLASLPCGSLNQFVSGDPEWNTGEWLQPGLFVRTRDLASLKDALAAHLLDPISGIV
jgi:hypothetical protein